MPRTSEQKQATLPSGVDTLAWSQFLRDSGVPKSQAEAQVKLIAQAVGQNAASKDDLERVKSELESKIVTSCANLKIDILRWMFGMFLAQTALIVTLIQYLGT